MYLMSGPLHCREITWRCAAEARGFGGIFYDPLLGPTWSHRAQAFSERLKDAEHRAQCSSRVAAAHPFEHLPWTERFFLPGLSQAVGHSFRNAFEQFRFETKQHLAQNKKIEGG